MVVQAEEVTDGLRRRLWHGLLIEDGRGREGWAEVGRRGGRPD